MEVSRSALDNSSISAKSLGKPFPWVHAESMATSFCEPTRQGTHLPQDSFLKNWVVFRAISNMQRSSAHTTRARAPSIEPASASDLKSSRTSTIDAGKKPEEGPDGAKPFNFLPGGLPPAYLKITSETGRPM